MLMGSRIISYLKAYGQRFMKDAHDEYLPRLIDINIGNYLNAFGAVCVEGMRGSGKTRTALERAGSAFMLADPTNDFNNRKIAASDIRSSLEGDVPHLIDEWEECPAIWDAIRVEVDRRGKPGQFILTGSSTPERKGILHSGAGRIAVLQMRTMSLFEAGDSSGAISLKDICSGIYKGTLTKDVKLTDLVHLIVRGGWPESLDDKGKQRSPAGKYPKLIMRDPTLFPNSRKQKALPLLKALARNESKTVSISSLANSLSDAGHPMDRRTIEKHLKALRRCFLIEDLKPFVPSFVPPARIKQGMERHFSDPSVSCAVLGLTEKDLFDNQVLFDSLFKSLAIHDLRVYADTFDGTVCHYRDYQDEEIDAIIELPGGDWCAFEISVAAYQIDSAAKKLLHFKEKMSREGCRPPKVLCVIVGVLNAAYLRKDGVYVVPLTALRN